MFQRNKFQRNYTYNSRKKAEKKPEERPEEEVALFLSISNAENIEVGRSMNDVKDSVFNYKVVFSLEQGKEEWLMAKNCRRLMAKNGSLLLNNPVWDTIWLIQPFKMGYEFIQLEVIRVSNRSDAIGTSNGTLVVGRAHIPVPDKTGVVKKGRYALVRVDEESSCKIDAGHIYVSMELKVKRRRSFAN